MEYYDEVKDLISSHTKMGQIIRTKLKRMISKLPLPDIEIERYILNYIGIPPFPFTKPIYLKKHKKIVLLSTI